MGHGIAHVASRSGYDVTLVDLDEQLLTRAVETIGKEMQRAVDKEKMSGADRQAALARIKTTTNLNDLKEAAFAVDVQEAFVAVGSVAVMQQKFFTDGDGADVLGDLQPIAVTAASELEEDFWRIGALFLSEAEVTQLRGDIDAHVAGRAITGRDFTVTAVRRRVRQVRQSGRFDWVVDLPMSPFRALEGVGSGAEAIHEFAGCCIGDSDQNVGVIESSRKVLFEARQGLW